MSDTEATNGTSSEQLAEQIGTPQEPSWSDWDDVVDTPSEDTTEFGQASDTSGENNDIEAVSEEPVDAATTEEGKEDTTALQESAAGTTEEEQSTNYLDTVEIADKLLKVKVDGEEQEMTLQEVLNRASGDVAVENRFNEVDKEKKALEQEIEQVNGWVSTFAEKMKSKDAVSAMQYLTQLTGGMAPHQVKEALIEQLQPEFERRQLMTEEELSAQRLSDENEYLKSQRESETTQKEKEQAKEELFNQIEDLREAHDVESDQFWSTAEYLETDPDAQRELIEKGYKEITPELVIEHVQAQVAIERAVPLVDDFTDHFKPEMREQVEDEVTKIILTHPEFDDADVKDVLNTFFVENQKKTVEKKLVEKTQGKTSQTNNKYSPVVTEGKEAEDWDDIE